MRTRTWALVLLLGAVWTAVPGGTAMAKKAAVVLSKNLGPFQEVAQGITAATSMEVKKYEIEGSAEKGRALISGPEVSGADVVITIGKEAADAARSSGGSIPWVYTMVLEPLEIEGKRKCAGILMQVRLSEQIGSLAKLFPGAKNIGVIYDSAYSSDVIREARRLAEQRGLLLTPMAITGPEMIELALNKLTEIKPDVLWSVPDHTMVNPAVVQQIIAYTRANKLPFIGMSMFHVKSGALASISVDLKAIGAQAADAAERLLNGTAMDPVSYPDRTLIFVNGSVQKETGNKAYLKLPNLQLLE